VSGQLHATCLEFSYVIVCRIVASKQGTVARKPLMV